MVSDRTLAQAQGYSAGGRAGGRASGRADLASAVVRSVPVPDAADGGRYYPSHTLEHPVSTREYPSNALLQPTAARHSARR